MGEREFKWGMAIDDNNGHFLLGFNFNIAKWQGYLCIYLGFKTLIIGKDYF